MARRGRKPKFKFDLENYKETVISGVSLLSIIAGGVCFLAVITAFFSPDATSFLSRVVTNNFGYSSLWLSALLIYFGLLFIGTLKWEFLNYRFLIGMVLFFLGLLGLLGSGAGTVGAFVQNNSSVVISFLGSMFLYFAFLAIGIGVMINRGFGQILEYLFEFFPNFIKRFTKVDLPEEQEEETELALLEPGHQAPTYKVNQAIASEEAEVEDIEDDNSESNDFKVSHSMSEDKDDGIMVHPKYQDVEIVKLPSSPVGEGNELLDDSSSEELEAEYEEEVEEVTSGKEKGIPKLPFSNRVWEYPSLDLLSNAPTQGPDAGNVHERAKAIEETLGAFGVKAGVVDINPGPAVTQYALSPAIGTKASKIQNLSTDLALRIKSPSGSVRVVAPIPGTNLIGIEVPNFSPASVTLRNVLNSNEMRKSRSKLTVAVGLDVQGNPVVQDMTKWPHALVAGSTGSGKSVMLNAIIASLLFRCSPAECRFIMIDPKMVEMTQYNGIPHLLTPVVTDVEQKAVSAFAWAVSEMERRYKVFAAAGVRNIEGYNAQSGFQAEPYIVIIVDELSDMMMVAPADVERYIARLAQKSRAVGIHLILATQRPSVNVLTGIIKANIPTRIAFKVTSNVDSRVIIDQSGAETLIGRGDMLFVPPTDSKATRIQGVWVSDPEINALVQKLKDSGIEPDYREEIVQQKVAANSGTGESKNSIEDIDEKMMDALEIIVNEGKASASYLQRRLGLGYSRAARIIDELESMGIIGRANGSKPRDVLVGSVQEAVTRFSGGTSDENS